MRLNRLAFIVITLLPAAFATAQTLPYASSRTKINAGVLLIDSQRLGLGTGAPANTAPHVWSNLDKDNGVKPASWSFDNPLGQTTMTADAFNRWSILQGGPGALPNAGTQLGKSDAAYWEISLTTSTADTLAKFDVLSLTLNGTLSLNSIERAKLRRFIDQGGILWVDLVNDAALTTDLANGLPYGFDWTVTAQPVEANLNHPLMRSPNPIRLEDLDQMKYTGTLGDIVTRPIDLSGMGIAPLLSWITPDSLRLEPIAGNTDGRSVSSAQLGEGYLVVTTGGVTATINRGYNAFAPPPRSPQVNRGFRGLAPVLDQASIAAAKFAINVISLATNYSTSGGNSRHSGGSAVTVDAPMLERFRANFGPGAFEVNKSAAIFKGYIITTADRRISVFDANPSRDIDHDGDPDDGIVDPLGSGTDLIWQSEVYGDRLSAPTVVEVPSTTLSNPLTGLMAINQIWVLDTSGQLRVFDLENPGGIGLLSLLPAIQPPLGETPAIGDPSGPYAPTIHEGLVVVADSRAADNFGRVWLVDLNSATRLNTGINDWSLSSFSRMSPAGGSASVGYIPIQDGSFGLDRVIYVPHQPTVIGSPRPASLTSIWLGARGEQPVRTVRTGGQVRITTRASYQRLPVYFGGGANSLGIKITLLKPNGDPFTIGEMQTVFTGGLVDPGTKGDMIVQLTGAPGLWDFDGTMTPGNTADDVGWRLDYTIDWGQVSLIGGVNPSQYVRGTLEFPDTVSNSRRIMGGAALGPNGNILIATSEPGVSDIGSTLFNLKETGRGEFTLLYRYDLYDELTFSLNQGTGLGDTITIPPTFVDQDELLADLPFLDAPISNLKFVGGPVVRGDTVYCVAAGRKAIFGTGIPTSVMMTFDADPAPLEFEITGSDTNFTLVQPDITRSTTKTVPTTFSTLRQGQFSAERIPNTRRVRIILTSAMSVSNNRISDTISSSLPIIVRRSGQTDTLVEPEAPAGTSWGFTGSARGKFDPLQWYGVLNGYRCITPPVVTGQTMFFAGASILPDLITNGFGLGAPPTERGLIYAFGSEVSPTDDFLKVNTVRTWQQQLTTVKKASPAPGHYTQADTWLWPQFRGTEDFEDIRIRMMQATLPEQQAISLAVGGQALAVTGTSNLYGFARSDFFVVDEGRVSRFDTSGNPLWSATQTLNAGRNRPVVNAGTGKRLSRPTRMYPDPSNSESFWIVDSGNDRVALVDASGRELRTVTSFKIDQAFVPPGMGDSESLTLRDPRDVYVFESRVQAANNGFSNARPLELWRHIVIAEAGHNRVIELIDRYELDVSGRVLGVVSYVDPNAGVQQALGILKWHTPEELTGKRFSYNSIANSFVDDGFGGKRKVVSFGFGNVEPGRATFGLDSAPQDLDVSSGYGGVVLYDGPNSIVITSFAVPEIAAGTYLEETAPGSGLYDFISAVQPAQSNHKIAGLGSVTLRYINTLFGPRLSVLITEATGVYELVQPDPVADPDTWVVNWMLTGDAYKSMRRPRGATPYNVGQLASNPERFRPQYARRLDSGEVLVVNSYMGRTRGNSEFLGEVVLVDGTIGGTGVFPGYDVLRANLGFNSLSVIYELPPVQGIRGIVRPVYAERQ